MSNKSSYVKVKDRIPYRGKGVDELTLAIRKILSDHPYTQKIVMEVGTPHIYIEEMIPEDQASNLPPKLNLHDVIRTNRMEEYEAFDGKNPFQQLWDIFAMLHDEGFEACAIAAGNKAAFQKWLGVRIGTGKVLETPFHIVAELPPDVFVVCGASSSTGEFEDIKFSVKNTI